MENVDIENPSTPAVRHPRQTVPQSSLISSVRTSIKTQRSHLQCHLLIITRSLWLLVHSHVISCEKEARAYTIIDQCPSISKTGDIIRVTFPAYFHLAWNFSSFVPWTRLHQQHSTATQLDVEEEECGGVVDSIVFIARHRLYCEESLTRLLKTWGTGRLAQASIIRPFGGFYAMHASNQFIYSQDGTVSRAGKKVETLLDNPPFGQEPLLACSAYREKIVTRFAPT